MPSEGELQAAAHAIEREAPAHIAPSAARRFAEVALDAAERVRNVEDQDRKRRWRHARGREERGGPP